MESKMSVKSKIVEQKTNCSKEDTNEQTLNKEVPDMSITNDQDGSLEDFKDWTQEKNDENISDDEPEYPNADIAERLNSSDEYMSNMSEDECATFNCIACGKKFKNTISLKAHLAKKHNPRALVSCEFCYTKYRGDFSEHLKSEHSLIDGGYKCKKCDFICGDYKSIQNHRHEKEIFLVCKYCRKMYKSKENYEQHLENHEMNESLKKKKKLYNCQTCGKKIVVIGSLKDLKTDKKSGFKLKCKTCRDVFRNYGGRIYKCTHCNTAFCRRGDLKEHMPKHSKRQPISANNN